MTMIQEYVGTIYGFFASFPAKHPVHFLGEKKAPTPKGEVVLRELPGFRV